VHSKGETVGKRLISVLIGLVLVVSACSSSSSDSGEIATDAEAPTTSSAATGPASTDTAASAESTTTVQAAPSSGGSGTATVALDNGESFSFSVICGLESQEVAGTVIAFTAVSNDEPLGFDVTQFGTIDIGVDTGDMFDGLGNVTIWNSSDYETVWEAGSILAQLDGSDFTLELNGTTITGSGMFVEGGDIEKLDTAVHGEVIAECG
jgi:hypothetical protein